MFLLVVVFLLVGVLPEELLSLAQQAETTITKKIIKKIHPTIFPPHSGLIKLFKVQILINTVGYIAITICKLHFQAIKERNAYVTINLFKLKTILCKLHNLALELLLFQEPGVYIMKLPSPRVKATREMFNIASVENHDIPVFVLP